MRRSLLTVALALALLGSAVAVSVATPGEFDTTFDTDGIRTLDVTAADFGRDVLGGSSPRAKTGSGVTRLLRDVWGLGRKGLRN